MNRREALSRVSLMLGGTLSAPTLLAFDRWNQMTPESRVNSPSILNEEQREIMARVAERIIPKTDTPGAIDVGVPAFIELMLREGYTKPVQDTFLTGLGDLAGKGFLTASADQQTTLLKQVEAQTLANAKAGSVSFWQLIKELTVWGYFTSEAGIKSSFDYQPIPGKFEAIKIRPGQKDFMYGNQV
ncbi:gluconate 2-dehydrogenase subunit 3 family protein [Spirosoma radiotolerans]|uniref:Gluconate 2-dehydrogenase subunit 3 family protein n=1 Tax=Spirosoma radiotolerans TaxID=1379870 RepID=A0A0E3ZYT8_9BACT|nr:gluconate 2-dehydrogenase subunit 3 family protein [Spirosoma radiotolerans]AKD57200.1 hypothetical protein SD10_22210 [Spirosoma radiotolerans]